MTLNRPDLMALVGERVTVTDPGPGHTSTWIGKLTALADQPSLILDLDDGRRMVLQQYRCKVTRANDTTLVPCLRWSRTEPHDAHEWTTPSDSPVRCPGVRAAESTLAAEPLGPKVLAMLHEMIANLQQHINQRAIELAEPHVAEAHEAARQQVTAARAAQQRAETAENAIDIARITMRSNTLPVPRHPTDYQRGYQACADHVTTALNGTINQEGTPA